MTSPDDTRLAAAQAFAEALLGSGPVADDAVRAARAAGGDLLPAVRIAAARRVPPPAVRNKGFLRPKPTACVLIPELLAAHGNGTLSGADTERLARHVKTCERCGAVGARFAAAEQAWVAAAGGTPPAPPSVAAAALPAVPEAIAAPAPAAGAQPEPQAVEPESGPREAEPEPEREPDPEPEPQAVESEPQIAEPEREPVPEPEPQAVEPEPARVEPEPEPQPVEAQPAAWAARDAAARRERLAEPASPQAWVLAGLQPGGDAPEPVVQPSEWATAAPVAPDARGTPEPVAPAAWVPQDFDVPSAAGPARSGQPAEGWVPGDLDPADPVDAPLSEPVATPPARRLVVGGSRLLVVAFVLLAGAGAAVASGVLESDAGDETANTPVLSVPVTTPTTTEDTRTASAKDEADRFRRAERRREAARERAAARRARAKARRRLAAARRRAARRSAPARRTAAPARPVAAAPVRRPVAQPTPPPRRQPTRPSRPSRPSRPAPSRPAPSRPAPSSPAASQDTQSAPKPSGPANEPGRQPPPGG